MTVKFAQEGCHIDYTPAADVAAGAVLVVGSLNGVAPRAIAANTAGVLATHGVFDFPKVNGAVTVGAKLYWDADGDPQGGTAGSGAMTTTAQNGVLFALAVAAAGATDKTVRAKLIQPGA